LLLCAIESDDTSGLPGRMMSMSRVSWVADIAA
jgi:hypothetical protein